MSAYEKLTGFANSIQNEIPSDELDKQLKTITDADILSIEEIKQCTAVCKVFGVEYLGKSFQIFTTKNGEYAVTLPRVYSTGKVAVLEWGDEKFELNGEKPTVKFRNIGTVSGFVFKKQSDFFVKVELKPDDKQGDRTYNNSIAGFDDEDCVTWVDALKYLLIRAPKADRKVLIEAGGFSIISCEKVKGKPRDDGKESTYWNANILAADCPYMAFLPGEVEFVAGDVVTVVGNKFVLKRTGTEFNLGANFQKLSALNKGEHLVIGIELSKGDFGGYNLVLDTGEIVTANAKIRDWVACLSSIDTISADNPAVLTVAGSNVMKNGKTQTQVFVKLKNSVSFFQKAQSVGATMAKPLESKPDVLASTSVTVPNTGVEIKDPWL